MAGLFIDSRTGQTLPAQPAKGLGLRLTDPSLTLTPTLYPGEILPAAPDPRAGLYICDRRGAVRHFQP